MTAVALRPVPPGGKIRTLYALVAPVTATLARKRTVSAQNLRPCRALARTGAASSRRVSSVGASGLKPGSGQREAASGVLRTLPSQVRPSRNVIATILPSVG
jgi:hypothetical protein